jgi:hypothetical protein
VSAFDFPLIDGVAPSWADVAVRISGVGIPLIEMGDISALSSSWTVEVGEQREGGRVIKRTRGSVSYEASMTLYASGYQKLLRGLASAAVLTGNQRAISLVTFNIIQMWTPPGGIDISQRIIKGCRILGNTQDSSEGTDAMQYELPLSPIAIVDVIDGVEVAPL